MLKPLKMGRTKRSRIRKANDKMRDKNVSACDSIVKLLQWMKESKWTSVCEMQPTEFLPIGLRGLMAKHKIDISDSIVRIPMNLLVTRKAAITFIERSKVFDFDSSFFSHMTTLELLAIFLIINKVPNNDLKCDQFWKPYIDTLPESYEVPYFCNEDEVIKFNINLISLCYFKHKRNFLHFS